MYKITPTNKFQKDLKKMQKRGSRIELLTEVIKILASGDSLPTKYKDHQLIGNYKGYRECHINPDWLLIYEICNEELILCLVRTGSHSDLF